MTTAEFNTLCRMLQRDGGATREAARLVLVDGLSRNAAARRVGITTGAVSRLVARLREMERNGCPTCGRSVGEEPRVLTTTPPAGTAGYP